MATPHGGRNAPRGLGRHKLVASEDRARVEAQRGEPRAVFGGASPPCGTLGITGTLGVACVPQDLRVERQPQLVVVFFLCQCLYSRGAGRVLAASLTARKQELLSPTR